MSTPTFPDERAWTYTHPYPYAEGVTCHMCKDELKFAAATHKVAEVTEDYRHELTAYVCCAHFAAIMGPQAAKMCAWADEPDPVATRPSLPGRQCP